jgi:hypothetical protein
MRSGRRGAGRLRAHVSQQKRNPVNNEQTTAGMHLHVSSSDSGNFWICLWEIDYQTLYANHLIQKIAASILRKT